jgi:hypothetical protein
VGEGVTLEDLGRKIDELCLMLEQRDLEMERQTRANNLVFAAFTVLELMGLSYNIYLLLEYGKR